MKQSFVVRCCSADPLCSPARGATFSSSDLPIARGCDEAYRTRCQVAEDGTITLRDLPFRQGEEVEVIVVADVRQARQEQRYPLRGKPLRYDDPYGPVAEDDWQALQ